VLASLLAGGSGSRVGLALSSNEGTQGNWVAALSPVVENYNKSGLVGLLLIAEEGSAKNVAPLLASAIKSFAGSAPSDAELKRAKAYSLGVLLKELNTKGGLLEAVGTGVLHSQQDLNPYALASLIEDITANQIKNLAAKVFSSRPTTVAIGDIDGLTDLKL